MITEAHLNFFKNKKILITGNTGFVGSNLSIVLSLLGSKVVGFSKKKKYKGYLSNHKNFKKKIKTIYGDINKINLFENDLKKFNPQIVVHLASQPIVKDSYIHTRETYKTNILGTIELLETIKKIKSVKQIIIFTSDKVYQNIKGKYLNENSKIGGLDPYSASKSSQDIIANSYKSSFFKKNKNLIIIRAGNIIGGGDFEFSRIVPELFLSLFNNKTLILRNPFAIRPWQHIFDVLYAIVLIIFNSYQKIQTKTIIYNIGPNRSSNIKVIKLVKNIKERINKFNFIKNKKVLFSETKILKLSNQLIKKKIKWKPSINISKTIDLTIDWYEKFYQNPFKVYEFTIKQIKFFFKI